MSYKIGDVVTIRKDLDDTVVYFMDNENYSDDCVEEMVAQRGQKFTIVDASERGYELEGINKWNWTDDMFEEEESE